MPTRTISDLAPVARLWLLGERVVGGLERLRPVALLGARLYVAAVFFRSGLTKLRDWDTTLSLFTHEYHVPWLNPEISALLGTGGELLLPVLLVLGLGGRFAAAGLTVVNLVAVVSLTDIPEPALLGHVFWGSLLIAVLLWGPGALSLDRWSVPALRRWLIGPEPEPPMTMLPTPTAAVGPAISRAA